MSWVAARAPGRRHASTPRPSHGGWDLSTKRNPSQILLWDGLISNPRYHPYSEDRMPGSSALEPPVCRRMHPLILHLQHVQMSDRPCCLPFSRKTPVLKFTLPVNTALSANRRLSLDGPAQLLTHLHSHADSTIKAVNVSSLPF